jgi:hypothetical protein
MRLISRVIVPNPTSDIAEIRDFLFEVHFTHIRNSDSFLFPLSYPAHKVAHLLRACSVQTICTIHPGPCQYSNQRPCGTPDAMVGVAFCSRKDNFNRVTGRKLALARAMNPAYDIRLRTGIWGAYLHATGII